MQHGGDGECASPIFSDRLGFTGGTVNQRRAVGIVPNIANKMICGSVQSSSSAMLTSRRTAGSMADIHLGGGRNNYTHRGENFKGLQRGSFRVATRRGHEAPGACSCRPLKDSERFRTCVQSRVVGRKSVRIGGNLCGPASAALRDCSSGCRIIQSFYI